MTPQISDADAVYAILPEDGETPLSTTRITATLPMTSLQVTTALQVLKREGRAYNPRGKYTNSWTRLADDVPHPSKPEMPAQDVQDLGRAVARIEGTVAGLSSRVGDLADDHVTQDQFDELLTLVRQIADHVNLTTAA